MNTSVIIPLRKCPKNGILGSKFTKKKIHLLRLLIHVDKMSSGIVTSIYAPIIREEMSPFLLIFSNLKCYNFQITLWQLG